MTRILIADDHEVVRSGLRSILGLQPGWTVVAEAADGKQAVAMAIETEPDVAVLDYSLPLMNGAEAARQIRKRNPKIEVLIFTMHDSEALIEQILDAGARGYVLKSDTRQHLISAIEALAVHKPFFSGRASENLLNNYLAAKNSRLAAPLSPRERIVVKLIAEGHTNKQMSSILNLSVKTIESQRAAALKKLNLASTAAIVRYAIRNRLVEP